MEQTERWSKRPQSTISQRNVDKELQRIKSLAVVSVLNKNFNKETGAPSRNSILGPVLSPSSSITTDSDLHGDSSTRNRSMSNSYSTPTSNYPLKKSSSVSLCNDFQQNIPSSRRSDVQMSVTTEQVSFKNENIIVAEKESNESPLVMASPIDTEKETLKKRVHELQELYDASIEGLQEADARNSAQRELVIIQDKLIQNMSTELDSLAEESYASKSSDTQASLLDTEEDKQALYTAQKELQSVKNELDEFKSLKSHYEVIISQMVQQISAHNSRMDELENIAIQIQKENATQIEYIDTKVQALVDRLLEANGTINKLQVEHIQEKQVSTKNEHVNNNSSIKSLNDSSSVIWETFEEDNEAVSARSSYISTSSRNDNSKHKSLLARWKGNSIPPASPPPSLPLPPIPSTSSRSNRPKSTLSEIYSTSSSITHQNRHLSLDAFGGGARRPSVHSELDEQMTDAAYYKEFTDQLQQRLSISKEIDDLRVWEPSDYDDIQKKIDSKGWSGSEDGGSQKDQSAFWKGMKKKLRV